MGEHECTVVPLKSSSHFSSFAKGRKTENGKRDTRRRRGGVGGQKL